MPAAAPIRIAAFLAAVLRVFIIPLPERRFGARPIEALLGAGRLLAVHEREGRRRLVRPADDGEQLEQVQARLGLGKMRSASSAAVSAADSSAMNISTV